MDPTLKHYIKEEPIEMNSCSQLSPLSPNSSGLGSSLHSQSPQTTNNYFAALRSHQLGQTSGGVNYSSNRADPILASMNIKNEAFSPQSMDICNWYIG